MPFIFRSSPAPRVSKEATREALDLIEGFYQGQQITTEWTGDSWRHHWQCREAVKRFRDGCATVFDKSLLLGVQNSKTGEPFAVPSTKEELDRALDKSLFIH